MTKAVWKFDLPINDHFTMSMPEGAEILSAGVQGGRAVLWALVDIDALTTERRFTLHGTGHIADDVEGLTFLGTLQYPQGVVFHLWEGWDIRAAIKGQSKHR